MQSSQASSASAVPERASLLPSGERRARLRRWRRVKDQLSKYGIAFAGISVVLAFADYFCLIYFLKWGRFFPQLR